MTYYTELKVRPEEEQKLIRSTLSITIWVLPQRDGSHDLSQTSMVYIHKNFKSIDTGEIELTPNSSMSKAY